MVLMMKIGTTDIHEPHPTYEMRTDDMGRIWSGPTALDDSLAPRRVPGGIAWMNDPHLIWHAPIARLLAMGGIWSTSLQLLLTG